MSYEEILINAIKEFLKEKFQNILLSKELEEIIHEFEKDTELENRESDSGNNKADL